MAAESPRKTSKYNCTVVRPQAYSDKSVVESVVDFISDVVPQVGQAYSGTQRSDDKEKIVWVKFERCDINDFTCNPNLTGSSEQKILPLLLVLGYNNGVQIWNIASNGDAQEILSLRQGPVRILKVLPSPDIGICDNDSFAKKRPLVAVCDSSSAGQPFCSVKFVSLRSGDEVYSVPFKTLPVHNIEANKRYVAVGFQEKIAVFDAWNLQELFRISGCYPSSSLKINPIALGTRWLAYADRRLVPYHQSCGGMSGDGSQSYAATVISAAKKFGVLNKGAIKGLTMFGEAMVSSVTGNKASPNIKRQDMAPPVDNGNHPGIVSVIDIPNIKTKQFSVHEDQDCDGLIAHFHAHTNEPVAAMSFDSSGTLLLTACKLGHNFHLFRLMAHPCSSSLGAVHHLYTLHRGETTAQVVDIAFTTDSRWVAVSTHRGTTHVFPITPYGGQVSVRTHCHARVVNRVSRFQKSAGISDIENPSAGRNSPVSGSPSSSGHEHYPTLIRQNALNNNMGNPRLPPYPHPNNVYPLAQLRQHLALPALTTGSSKQSPSHSAGVTDNIFNVCAFFAPSRLFVASATAAAERRENSGKKVVDSLFVMGQNGTLIEYNLEPHPKITTDRASDDTPLDLTCTGMIQWQLQRSKTSAEMKPPLPSNSPLLLATDAVITQQPTVPTDESIPVSRHGSKDSLSSDHSNTSKEDTDAQWSSQVEIITHVGPHRRLWMGPQFSFKTYQNTQNTTVLSSTSSSLFSGSPDQHSLPMDMLPDDCDLESLKLQPNRSSPVAMPTARPAYRRSSASDYIQSPNPHISPLLIEAGSFDQSPNLNDVVCEWAESSMSRQPRSSEEEEDRLRETLADAMVESPIKDCGPSNITMREDAWQDFKGYTYSVDPVSKKRIWSHCKFPNPTADVTRCGFPDETSRPGYICDPDGIIPSSNNAMVQINQQLIAIQENTSTLCDGGEKQRQSYIVTVALIDEMRIADLQDTGSCINDCNEIQPTLNITLRQPTDGEVDTMMRNFADSLRASWAIGACDNDVVIFYSNQFNKVYTSVGSKASSILTESKLSALHSSFLESVNNGKLEDGLLLLVNEVRTNLRSFTPAHILLVVNVVIIVILVLFFTFFLHLSDVELNVWGDEKQWVILDVIVKFLTGVWFLNFMFLGIGNTLYRLNIWASLVCLLAAIGCIVIVYEHDVIFTSRSTVTNFNFTA